MHFHVEVAIDDAPAHALGGDFALDYDGDRPVFVTRHDAVDAARAWASAIRGIAAGLYIEVELWVALELGDRLGETGATATWGTEDHPEETTTWSIRSCECTEGSLAELFNEHR